MRSKRKNLHRAPNPVYRAIKVPLAIPASPAQAGGPAASSRPGEAGKAAVTAAALHQLNRYAQDIQEFLEDAQMQTLVDRVQADLDPSANDPIRQPNLRLHRD